MFVPPRPRNGTALVKTILNALWLVLAGFWLSLAWAVVGLLCYASIIGIPAGVASFRIARHTLWPFGRTIVDKPGAGTGSVINNVIWIVLFGWELALAKIIAGVVLCLTVVGIPLGMACFKLVPVALVPFGKTIVRTGSHASVV
jgi:uncharacterized membrane protein YccF (DUF307 family)